jgi:hypothetical protein
MRTDCLSLFIAVESRNGSTSYLNARVTLLPIDYKQGFVIIAAIVKSQIIAPERHDSLLR